MKKIAIVGGSGFVGSAIAKKIKESDNIHCACYGSLEINLLEPKSWSVKIQNLDTVIVATGVVEADIKQLEAINVTGLNNFAQFCKESNVKKFILISTGAVYGNSGVKTFPGFPLNPQTEYAKSKLNAELLVKKTYPTNLNILRLYFPYGQGEKPNRLIPKIKQNILEKKPVLCRPDGGPFLSLMHIDDMSKIIVDDFVLGDVNQCEINIASDKIVSVRELALRIAKGIKCEVIFDYGGTSYDVISVPYPGIWRDYTFY